MNNPDKCATKRVFGYSTLLFIAVTNLFSFLSGFKINSFFTCRIEQISLKLQVYFGCCSFTEVNSFRSKNDSAFCVYGFSMMDPLFKVIFR